MHINERLLCAAEIGNSLEVQRLIGVGADPNIGGGKALKISAAKGHIGVMQVLVRNGAKIDEPGKWGHPALTWAATNKQIASIQFLLSQGADPSATNSSALIVAIANNSYDSVVCLLKNTTFSQSNLRTALLWATEKDYVEIAKELVKHGAHVHSRHIATARKYNAIQILQFFSSINETQKNAIEGTLRFIFDTIAELTPLNAIQALKAIIAPVLSEAKSERLERQDVLDCVQQVREILSHPSPQNRSTNYPYFGEPRDPTIVVYKDLHGKPAFEKKGLLSLTALDNEDTSVTKEAVDNYIHQLVDTEITTQSKIIEKAAGKIQFWYS